MEKSSQTATLGTGSNTAGGIGREEEKGGLKMGGFDSAFDASEYPDVATSGLDPAVHFLMHGWAGAGRRTVPGKA
jgi:hypothetical protein